MVGRQADIYAQYPTIHGAHETPIDIGIGNGPVPVPVPVPVVVGDNTRCEES